MTCLGRVSVPEDCNWLQQAPTTRSAGRISAFESVLVCLSLQVINAASRFVEDATKHHIPLQFVIYSVAPLEKDMEGSEQGIDYRIEH